MKLSVTCGSSLALSDTSVDLLVKAIASRGELGQSVLVHTQSV